MRYNPDFARKLTCLPAAAVCVLGVFSVGGCSSATREKITNAAAQAVGADTLKHQKDSDGSTVFTLDSNAWKEVLTVKPIGDIDLQATYTGITGLTVSKATGTLVCSGGTLNGDITSDLSPGHLRRLRLESINMQPHAVSQPDGQVCDGKTFKVRNADDARHVLEDVFGKYALAASDASN